MQQFNSTTASAAKTPDIPAVLPLRNWNEQRRPDSSCPVRAFLPKDVSAVAELFQRVFRQGGDAPRALEQYFEELFFEDPWRDPELASRVYFDSADRLAGFLAAMPLHMTHFGRPIRAVVPTAFMIDQPSSNPFAGIALLKEFLNGPQRLCLTDTASPLVRAMWIRIGGAPADAYSNDWWHVLRPASFSAFLVSRGAWFSGPFNGVGRSIDWLMKNIVRTPSSATSASERTHSHDVSEDEFIKHLGALTQHYALKPAWDEAGLLWRLRHADRRMGHGKFFRRVVLARDRVVGCYLYNAHCGKVARVLELIAKPGAYDLVYADVIRHADHLGAIAVRGRCKPELTSTLLKVRCFLTHRLSTLIHCQDKELIAAILSGNSWITGLAGDSWTRLFDDEFTE